MEIVEHWFNGQWGWARADVWLHRDGDRWTVVAQERLRVEGELRYTELTEAQARAYVRHLLRTVAVGVDRWRDIA